MQRSSVDLAAPVGGDETDAVAGVDDKVQFRKQRRTQRHAEIADVDEGHDRSLVLPAIASYPGHAAITDVRIERGDVSKAARAKIARRRMATKGRPE